MTLLNNNLCFRVSYTGFENRVESVANIRGPALLGANGVIVFGLPLGPVKRTCLPIYGEQLDFLKEGLLYINITSTTEGCEIGDIRGQILPLAAAPAS